MHRNTHPVVVQPNPNLPLREEKMPEYYPKEFFSETQIEEEYNFCFVLMPFAPSFNEIYSTIQSATQKLGMSCKRGDDFYHSGRVMNTVLENIQRAEIIIADLTKRNANVFYELGIAHKIMTKNRLLMQGEDAMNDNSTMQECPKCHERQVAEKKLIRKVYGHDTVLGKPPKKFHISGILIAGVALFIIMLRLITQAFPYNPSTRVATNPRLAIEYTIGAVCLTILFCVGLLLYQQFSYPKKIKEYEDLKNKSVEKYVCRKCGAAWDIA